MIEQLVYECIRKHEGGEKFFDALDDIIRKDDYILNILANMGEDFGKAEYPATINKRIGFIVSGKFGVAFQNWVDEDEDVFLVNGNLRPDGNEVDVVFDNQFKEFNKYNKNVNWVFIDDSYFLGRTANKVREFVERNGGDFAGIVVAYDGSKGTKRTDLKCLYRYYDKMGEIK